MLILYSTTLSQVSSAAGACLHLSEEKLDCLPSLSEECQESSWQSLHVFWRWELDIQTGNINKKSSKSINIGFLQLDEYSNQLAHFLLSSGFQHGDSVALFMENKPEYVGLWLGCTKIGVVPALINFNLRGKSLMHSISAVSASAVIFGTELTSGIVF